MSIRALKLLPLFLAFALFAASCGDDDADNGAADDGSTAAATTAAPEPAVEEPVEEELAVEEPAVEEPAVEEPAEEPATVGLALPTARNDGGFSQSYYDGLLAAEEAYGLTIAVQDNAGDPEQTVDALRNLAATNGLVIGVGAQFAEAGTIVAPEFPEVEFAIVNGQATDDPNLHIYIVRQGVPAYPAGVIAADLTQTNKVGFIGGLEIPPTTQSADAFSGGATSVNPDIETVATVVGDFEDVAGAKEAAAAQIAAGADVLFAFVNSGLEGVLQAVDESGEDVKIFSVIFPQCDRSTQLVGTATLSSLAQVDAMVSAFLTGSMPSDLTLWGVEDPSIQSFVLCPDYASADLEAQVADLLAGINDGSIVLPAGV